MTAASVTDRYKKCVLPQGVGQQTSKHSENIIVARTGWMQWLSGLSMRQCGGCVRRPRSIAVVEGGSGMNAALRGP